MNIVSRVKNFFTPRGKQGQSPVTPTDKWGDPWINLNIKYGPGTQPDLAECQRTNSFLHNKCPHCGQEDLRDGPRGMGSQNFLCASCGSKFNDSGVFGVDLLRDCINPIPEMDIDATHDHFGPVQPKSSVVPPAGARRAAIQATKEKNQYMA